MVDSFTVVTVVYVLVLAVLGGVAINLRSRVKHQTPDRLQSEDGSQTNGAKNFSTTSPFYHSREEVWKLTEEVHQLRDEVLELRSGLKLQRRQGDKRSTRIARLEDSITVLGALPEIDKFIDEGEHFPGEIADAQ
ncbi:MAG: hypothetical protein IH840_00435 [Candidatus Heimdallarchaeota archaeon]|nr:hypothetical protein [Candidatus Heimdallarchaeota archaeon]